MAVLSSLFNIGTQYPSAPPQGTMVSSQKLAEEISPFYKDLLAKSQALYNQQTEEGYTPYTAPTMAQFSPEQQQAFSGIQGLVGSQKPVYDEGMALTRGTTRRFTPETAQALMNPYQQAVTDIEKRNIQENYESKVLPELRAQAAQIQPFGGSRQAILEGMASDANQRLLADVQAKGSLTAYNDAQRLFADQIRREGMAASQLPTLASAAYKTQAGELGALQAVGEEKQKQTQSALDEAYRTYLEEKRFPETSMGQYQAIVQGFPALRQEIQRSAPPPQPSMANQLIGGLGTLGSLYGAYGGFTDAGFGSALPGYGPVNQKEGSGSTTILPRQNAGMANPYDPRYDMSFEDPNMIGEVEQNRLMESQRLQQLELMSDPSILENQYRAAMTIVNGGTPEEVMRSQQIMRGATELGVDMQALIDEVRASNREEAAIDRQEFIQGIGDKVGGGLQSLQEVLGARNIIPRQSGGPASGAMIKYNYPRSQHKGPVPIGSSFSDDVKGGLVPVNLPIQRQNVSSSFQTPTPVAAETTQPNTQLLPSDTTNRVDPRRQPPYTGVIGTGGLVDITDDGLQVFQKTQQGILNRSLYGGVLEAGNPALASTPIEETTPTPAAPMSSTIAGMLEKSPLVTTDTSSAPSVLPKDLSGVDNAALSPLLSMPSVQSRGGVYNASEIRDAGIDLNRPSDAPETIVSSREQTKFRDPRTGLIPYDLYVPQPVNTFGQGYDLKDMDYFTANALALSEGADRFMYNNEYAAVDPGLLSNYDYTNLGTKPYAAPVGPIQGVSYSGVSTGRGGNYANLPQNPNSPAAMRARGYIYPGRGLPPMYVGVQNTPISRHQGRAGGGQIISRKGGGLVDLPVVKRKTSGTASGFNDKELELIDMYNKPNTEWQERQKIREFFKRNNKLDQTGLTINLTRDAKSYLPDITLPDLKSVVGTLFRLPDNIISGGENVLRTIANKELPANTFDSQENLAAVTEQLINDAEINLGLRQEIDPNMIEGLSYGSPDQQAMSDKGRAETTLLQDANYTFNRKILDTINDFKTNDNNLLTTTYNNIIGKKDDDKETDQKTDTVTNADIEKNKNEIISTQTASNNTALSLLDQYNLITPTSKTDSALLNYESKLNAAINKTRNKNAAVVKAIKDQDKRIKDRIAQAPEAIRMEIFARMAQGFASMATSASPPVQAFLEQVPSFVEDTTAIGRAQRERVENLEDLAVESARAEAALADSEFGQEVQRAAFKLDQANIQQKQEAALLDYLAENMGTEKLNEAMTLVKTLMQDRMAILEPNQTLKLGRTLLSRGPEAMVAEFNTMFPQNQIAKEEAFSFTDAFKNLMNK
jgi:hypothetical protein